ncbi:MAG: NAD-dependent epimerase/dehydratase family protein [Pseudomonadota bacterium]
MTGRLNVAANVAVTGATGFIGSILVRRLLQKGCRLRLLLRRPEAWQEIRANLPDPTFEERVEIVEGAVEQEEALSRLVQGASTVIHCAGLIKARQAEDFHRVNAEATERLCAAAGRTDSVERMIYLSTLAAREPQLSAYAESKRNGEDAVRAWSNRLELVIVRPPAVYGPGDRATLPLFQQMNRGLLAVPARPGARFSLIHAQDLVEALTAALDSELSRPLCLEPDDETENGYGWEDLVEIAGEATGHRVRLLRLPPALVYPIAWSSEMLGRMTARAPVLTPGKLRELSHADWRVEGNWRRQLPDCPAPRGFLDGFTQTLNWYKQQEWL